MNRNVENWLRAAIFVIGGIGGTGIAIWGLMKFYKFSPEYFNFTAVGLFSLVFLYTIIKFIKDELDLKDASEKYYREKYPSYFKDEKKK